MLVSVIVATYNRPDALAAVLSGLRDQTDTSFEVIVADDGSGPATRAVVSSFSSICEHPIVHVWHEDQGFRLSAIRNRAAVKARGDYLVFIDGDCIPRPDFVAQHRALAERGWMVAGNRVLLAEKMTHDILQQGIAVQHWAMSDWRRARRAGHINRTGPLRYLPLGTLRKLGSKRWQRVRGCNMAVWKSDLLRVNGFEEAFEGWGHEDSDFAVRLINAGVGLKKGAYATALLHLWHRENDRQLAGKNWERLQRRIASRDVRAAQGLDRYLIESAVTDS
jgi:glycosyltransferase involved in cell wall biosynthesis